MTCLEWFIAKAFMKGFKANAPAFFRCGNQTYHGDHFVGA